MGLKTHASQLALTLSVPTRGEKSDLSYLHAITYYLECAKAVVDLAPDTHKIDWLTNGANVLSIAASQFGLCKSQAGTVAKDLFAFTKNRFNCYQTELWYRVVCDLRVHQLKILEIANKDDLLDFAMIVAPPKDIMSHTQAHITSAKELSIAILQIQRVLTVEYIKQKDYAAQSIQLELLYGKTFSSFEAKLISSPDWHIIYACIEALEQVILMRNANEAMASFILNGREDPLCKVQLIGLEALHNYHPEAMLARGNRWCIRSRIAELAIKIIKNNKYPTIIKIANDILEKQRAAERPDSKVYFILNQSPEDWKIYLEQLRIHFPTFKNKTEHSIAELTKKIDERIASSKASEEDTKELLKKMQEKRDDLKNALIHFQEMICYADAFIKRHEEKITRIDHVTRETHKTVLQLQEEKRKKKEEREAKIKSAIFELHNFYSSQKKNTLLLFPEKLVPIDRMCAPLIIEECPQINSATATEAAREDFSEDTRRIAIDYKNIFTHNTDSLPSSQKYLISGHSGVGKSTFCQIAANQWAQGKLWPHFTGVFWINFRNLNTHRYPAGQTYNWVDILNTECLENKFSSSEVRDALADYINNNKNQFLFLLDGYDELPSYPNSDIEYLRVAWEELCNKSYCLMTANLEGDYHSDAFLTDYRKLEMMGFTYKDIVNYVNFFFTQQKNNTGDNDQQVNNLMSLLKRDTALWKMAHTPLHLNMICQLAANHNLPTQDQTYHLVEVSTFPEKMKKNTIYVRKEANNITYKTIGMRNTEIITSDLFKDGVLPDLNNKNTIEFILCILLNRGHIKQLTLNALYAQLMQNIFEYIFMHTKELRKNTTALTSSDVQEIQKSFAQLTYNQIFNANPNTIFSEAVLRKVVTLKDVILNVKIEERLKKLLSCGLLRLVDGCTTQYEYTNPSMQSYFIADVIAKIIKEKKINSDCYKTIQETILHNRYNPKFQQVWFFVAGHLSTDIESLKQYFGILLTKPRDLMGVCERNLLLRCLAEAGDPTLTYDGSLLTRTQLLQPLLESLQDKNSNEKKLIATMRIIGLFGNAAATPAICAELNKLDLQVESPSIKKAATRALVKLGIKSVIATLETPPLQVLHSQTKMAATASSFLNAPAEHERSNTPCSITASSTLASHVNTAALGRTFAHAPEKKSDRAYIANITNLIKCFVRLGRALFYDRNTKSICYWHENGTLQKLYSLTSPSMSKETRTDLVTHRTNLLQKIQSIWENMDLPLALTSISKSLELTVLVHECAAYLETHEKSDKLKIITISDLQDMLEERMSGIISSSDAKAHLDNIAPEAFAVTIKFKPSQVKTLTKKCHDLITQDLKQSGVINEDAVKLEAKLEEESAGQMPLVIVILKKLMHAFEESSIDSQADFLKNWALLCHAQAGILKNHTGPHVQAMRHHRMLSELATATREEKLTTISRGASVIGEQTKKHFLCWRQHNQRKQQRLH